MGTIPTDVLDCNRPCRKPCEYVHPQPKREKINGFFHRIVGAKRIRHFKLHQASHHVAANEMGVAQAECTLAAGYRCDVASVNCISPRAGFTGLIAREDPQRFPLVGSLRGDAIVCASLPRDFFTK